MDLVDELLGDQQRTGGTKQAGKSSLLTQVLHYRALLLRGWWILALTTALALAVGAWFLFQQPPKYRSVGRMMVSGKIALPEGTVYTEELSNFFGTQVELMKSEAVRRRAEAQALAMNPELKPGEVKLEVGQQKGASIFILSATGDDAAYTRAYLDAIMEAYIASKREMRSQKSDITLSAITEQLSTLDKTLQGYEAELHAFEKENNVGYLQQGGNSAGSYLASIEQRLAAMKTEHELLERLDIDQNARRQKAAASGGENRAPDSVTTQFGPEADYMKANQQLQLLRARLEDFSQYLRPKHPFIAQLNNEIALQERLIAIFKNQSREQLGAQRESIRIQIENLQAQAEEWRAKALDLSQRMGQYERLKSRLDRAKGMYDKLLTSMQTVDVNKNIDQDIVTILERASTAFPVKLGVTRTMGMALFVGLALGIGILLLMDQLDDKLKTVSSFQAHFSEPIMGQIARESQSGGEVSLLQPDDSRHLFAEAFSNIRSALFFLPGDEKRPKTLLITSAIPNEGKSTVTSNLAVTLAMGGAKTLLVDADLRRGQLVKRFGLPPVERGFSEVLTQEADVGEVIIPAGVTNLSLLPRGRILPQPSRFLLGGTMDRFLHEIYEEFDFIVFDSAPILAADDTTSFAPKLDASLLVMRLNYSSVRSSRKALEFLYNRRAKVLGVILNAVDSAATEYTYYQYYDYYHQRPAEASRS